MATHSGRYYAVVMYKSISSGWEIHGPFLTKRGALMHKAKIKPPYKGHVEPIFDPGLTKLPSE
jgi:hypothetical protein